MKSNSLFLACLFLLLSCGGGSDDPGVDCSAANINGTVAVTNASCGEANGALTISGSGGTSPYTYQIPGKPVQNAGSFTALSAGNYTITVKDRNGCSNELAASVGSEGDLTLTASVAETSGCGTASGSIVATATGSSAVTYQLDNGPFQASNTFANLGAGNYTITAKDESNCVTSTGVKMLSGISYSNQVQALIETNCAISGCHGNSQAPLLNSFSDIKANANNINSRVSNGTMPPAGRTPLTDAQKQSIACWVNDGALNN